MALRDPSIPDRVHLGEIIHGGQPDGGLQDLCLVGTDFSQQTIDIGENILCLLGDASAGGADLARKIDDAAVDDSLAHARSGFNAFDVTHGLILVERSGQKRIVIGDKGARIKKVGQEARMDMENLFEAKVMLNLWVKVKGGWADDERALKSLGYFDE